jgi:hypothetical protein
MKAMKKSQKGEGQVKWGNVVSGGLIRKCTQKEEVYEQRHGESKKDHARAGRRSLCLEGSRWRKETTMVGAEWTRMKTEENKPKARWCRAYGPGWTLECILTCWEAPGCNQTGGLHDLIHVHKKITLGPLWKQAIWLGSQCSETWWNSGYSFKEESLQNLLMDWTCGLGEEQLMMAVSFLVWTTGVPI